MTYTHTPLGKTQPKIDHYNPDWLVTIPRNDTRNYPNIIYQGHDLWIAYEISWLSPGGKPAMAVGRFIFPAHSMLLIESKSMKWYLQSLNQTVFESIEHVRHTLSQALSKRINAAVIVTLTPMSCWSQQHAKQIEGSCLDHLPIDDLTKTPSKTLLKKTAQPQIIHQQLYSNLFKSNCRVTGQPDWATISIRYHGEAIDPSSLLTYLLSYRSIEAFHEPTIEHIYHDIYEYFDLSYLSVTGYFTRRGGIAICPKRSSIKNDDFGGDQAVLIRQ
jgi:7-cyano-7-deazaguanine reductase